MKDYEFYRAKFIAHMTDYLYRTITQIENLESPIERIAVMYTLRFRDIFGPHTYVVESQVSIGPYIADIVITDGNLKVAIECDGHEFHEKTKAQAAKDKKRDREFQKEGYVILRYTGSEIVNDPRNISEDLKKIFNIKVGIVGEG